MGLSYSCRFETLALGLRVIRRIKHPLAALIPHARLPGGEGELEEFRTPRPKGEGQG